MKAKFWGYAIGAILTVAGVAMASGEGSAKVPGYVLAGTGFLVIAATVVLGNGRKPRL